MINLKTYRPPINNWFWFLLFAGIIILNFCGCTPQQRLSRLVNKFPYLVDQKSQVTQDTIITPGYSRDTVFMFASGKKDTFILNTPQSVTRVYINKEKTAAAVSQEQKPDTTINTTQVISEILTAKENEFLNFIKKLLVLTAGGFVLAFILIQIIQKLKIVKR